MNASRDYYTENNGEIGFKTGDPLTIIEASQDAAFVKAQNRRNGKVGFIPLSTLSTSPPNLKSTATDLKIIQASVRSKSNSRSLSLNRGKLLEPDCMSLSSRASSTSSSSNSSTESGPNRSSRHIVHSNPKDIPSRRQSTFSSSGFGSSGPSCTSSFKEDMIRGTSESEYGSNDDSSFLFSRKSSATRSIIAEDRLSCSTYENTNEDLRERSPYENTPSSPPEDTVSPPLHSNPIAIPKSPKHMGASLRVPLGQSPPPTTGYMNPSPPRATFVDPSHVISLPNNVNHKQSNLVVVLNTSSESEAEQGLSNSAPTTKGEMKAAKVTKRKQRVERTEELSHRASFGSYKQKSQKTGSSTAAPFVDNAVYECMSMNENSTVNYELMEDNANVDRCNDRENYEDRSQRTNVRAEQDTSSCYENVSLSSPKDESVVIRTPPLPPKMTRSVYNRMSLPPRTYRKLSDESTTETHNITRDDIRKRASTTPPSRTFGKAEEPPTFRPPDKASHDVYENMATLPSRTYRKTADIAPVMSVPPRTYKSSNESYENVGPTEVWKPSSSDLSYENFNFNRSSSSGKYRSDSMYEERMISEQKDAFSFNSLRISSGERHSSPNERAFSPNERAFSPNERTLSSTEQVFLGKFSPDAVYENHDLRTAVDTPPPLPRKRSSRTECEMSTLPDQEFRSSSSLRMEQAIYENQEIKSYEGRDLHLDISDTGELDNERLADGERNLIDDSPIHKDLPSRYGTIWDGKEIIQESESIEVADFGEESDTSPNVTCEKLIPETANAKATADIEHAKDSLLSKPGKAMQQETIDQEHSSMLRALLSPKEQRSPRLDRAQSEETPIRPPRRHRKKSQSRRHTVGTLKLQERPAESSEAAFPRKPYDSAQKESIVEKLKASCPTENDPTAPPLPPREMHEACFQRQLSDFVQIETSDLECEAVEETEIKELEPPEAVIDDAKARNLQELEKADSFPEEIVIEETLEIKEKQEVAEKLETEVTKSASKPETGKSRFSKIKSLLSGKEPTDNPLTREMIADALSLICKTGNGLAHAYVKLDLHDKLITDISLLNCYIHLRYVDIKGNKLKEITTLNSLTHLLTLNADKNLLRSAKMDEMPYLQVASFANNKIMDTEGLNHPLLESLNLKNNQIIDVTGLDPKKLARLKVLELRGNKMVNTKGIELPNLARLYLGGNDIVEIEGLSELQNLVFLHLRENKIEKLDGFSEQMKCLQYLNLRKNDIAEFSEVAKLKCLPKLRALVLLENPVYLENGYRIEILILLRRLERLDKDPVNEEERQEAEEIYEQRIQEERQNEQGDELIQLEEEDE
eukprot:Seg179.4 transcript_id=Seg179.4/GoldUCD/mRNA.D3Y31 product="Leucine-rich repeat-containing protein 23" protein_id=Seg179.4/GoldUCD/D3Y31